MQKIGIIILAAGASTRMNGEPKQLLEFEGKTLLRRATETALSSGLRPIVVVLGANAEKLLPEIKDLPVLTAINENWASGMGGSIKTGLSVLLAENRGIEAAILMLCDQPFVTAETLNRLVETFQKTKKPIAVCQYADTVGVPALFAREMFAELSAFQGDTGAKAVIKKHSAEVAQTPAPEAAFDVDTQADFQKLLSD
ncbi:MAG TPA: nucleotidyltransferase family protein [Pyrinomonadaceae bacterium]|nr:nucleotidyltransferase family protein [Pyrinomonadaceae bacterium]